MEKEHNIIIIIVAIVAIIGVITMLQGQSPNLMNDETLLGAARGDSIRDTCFDTDGGAIPDVYGMVKFQGKKTLDECYDDTTVNEAYCNSRGLQVEPMECREGSACQDGVCELMFACRDTDNGFKPNTFGVLEFIDHGTKYETPDTCTDSNTLVEGFCEGVYSYTKSVDCASGELCEDGMCVIAPTCKDSDGGQNYAVYGITRGYDDIGLFQDHKDNCAGPDGDTLQEGFCTTYNTLHIAGYKCGLDNKVCVDGACVEQIGCTDSDGGLNALVKGNTVGLDDAGNFKNFTDFCPPPGFPSPDTLQEGFCSPTGTVYVTGYDCDADGLTCLDGECVAIPSTLSCGDQITQDTVMTEDLLNCPQNGLILAASDIILDCAGHTIMGAPGSKKGITWFTNLNHVEVKNCYVNDFEFGFIPIGPSGFIADLTLTGNTFSDMIYDGIRLTNIDNSLLVNNSVINNGHTGIAIQYQAMNSRLVNNYVCGNEPVGYGDIFSTTTVNSSGVSNTCDTAYFFNDDGTTGCTYTCTPPSTLSCGDTITEDTVMTEDLVCSGWAVILANGANLDCQGHSISQVVNTSNYGGINLMNTDGSEVKNCVVANFQINIGLTNSSNNLLINNTILNADGTGLQVAWSSSNNVITNNYVEGSGSGGITIYDVDSASNQITNNNIVGPMPLALSIGSSNNYVANNVVCGSITDIAENYGLVNTGIANTCDTTTRWNDDNASGCTYSC